MIEPDEQLITDHLNLARSIARRYHGRGESPEDLQQVAFTALVRAARHFDDARGVAFSTFATISIGGELKRHFRDRAWSVRAPRRLHDLYLQLGAANEALSQDLHRAPTVAEIAEHLGRSSEEVLESMEAGGSYRALSLDTPGFDDGRTLLDELPVATDAYADPVDRVRLEQVLPTLPDVEQLVVRRYFFDDRTQRAIGRELGVSQMQVSRLLSRSLNRLRQAF